MEKIYRPEQLVNLRAILNDVNSEYYEYRKQYDEIRNKIRSCENKKKDLIKQIKNLEDIIESEDIYANVLWIDGFETLTQPELVAISTGMDKTNYRDMAQVKTMGNEVIPRWIDLERLINAVVDVKKQYPGWVLESVQCSGHYDTLPPRNIYKFTYKTPQGHYMSYGE